MKGALWFVFFFAKLYPLRALQLALWFGLPSNEFRLAGRQERPGAEVNRAERSS
jgi:hypothetical protein